MELDRTPLTLRDGGSSVELAPWRGGMVTRFDAGGVPLLYLDEASLADEARNVRGGIPVLFPIAGRLTGDAFELGGSRHALKQHGFARNLPWEVVGRGDSEATLRLVSSPDTLRAFPFELAVEITYRLAGTSLTLDQRYTNRSDQPMPLHAGFHPYFAVPEPEKPGVVIETRATKAYDNVSKTEGSFHGFDLTRPEVDLHLVDHGGSAAALQRPSGSVIELSGSPEFSHWVVWTLAGKDFVCLEPWTAPGDALRTGERLLWIPPGETRGLSLEIRHVTRLRSSEVPPTE